MRNIFFLQMKVESSVPAQGGLRADMFILTL